MLDPRKIPESEREKMELKVAERHDIALWRLYSEKEAVWLLLTPEDKALHTRLDKAADSSTLRRNRRKNLVPYVPYGDGSVRYIGAMLCDYLLFGERAMLLWGGEIDLPAAAE